VIPHTPTEEEAAAALAAIAQYLAEEEQEMPAATLPGSHWKTSAVLITQGMSVIRVHHYPTWGNIERLRRASRAGTGIVGL
jgi:hypothetical protein